MFKDLKCIIGRFRTGVAILKFSREVCTASMPKNTDQYSNMVIQMAIKESWVFLLYLLEQIVSFIHKQWCYFSFET